MIVQAEAAGASRVEARSERGKGNPPGSFYAGWYRLPATRKIFPAKADLRAYFLTDGQAARNLTELKSPFLRAAMGDNNYFIAGAGV